MQLYDHSSTESTVQRHNHVVLRMLIDFLFPGPLNLSAAFEFTQLREQILTRLLRVGALLGSVTIGIAALPPLLDTPLIVLAIDTAILGLIWFLALARHLTYQLRASLLLASFYTISFIELTYYGFSQDASLMFAAFSLFALLLLNRTVSMLALAISEVTLLCSGLLISTGYFVPLAHPIAELTVSTAITTCLIFLMVVATLQVGLIFLFDKIKLSWQYTRSILEQQVAERTRELELAHAEAVTLSRHETAQKEYMRQLYQMTLDLLSHRRVTDLLQMIVDKAALLLDAPYGEIMLEENDELVVYAFTSNQPFLANDRVRRGEALLSWQAFDSQQPVVLDDYETWSGRRARYDSAALHAVADFPIIVGGVCVGVLGMGRNRPGYLFTSDDMLKGQLFSQLAALIVENARLYETALNELSRRLEAEQSLQRYADELQAQNEELEAFTRTVAHDLKLPLSVISGYGQLLMLENGELVTEQNAEMITTIIRTSNKMSETIDALLLLAQIRSSNTVLIDILAMDKVVAEVLLHLDKIIVANEATIYTPASWPVAHGYAPWVEEVWINYISNAIKYGGQPPQIQLGSDSDGDGFVRFWVQDNGPGLDAEQQAQLFKPFTRLHTERAQGYGLGLSIVQRIISKLGGVVGVESTPGQGSRFFFTLPVQPAEEPPLDSA